MKNTIIITLGVLLAIAIGINIFSINDEEKVGNRIYNTCFYRGTPAFYSEGWMWTVKIPHKKGLLVLACDGMSTDNFDDSAESLFKIINIR